jgi:GNAT superfamily N-acetyltransferase
MHFIHTNYGYCYYELDKPVSEGGTYLIYSLYVHREHRRKGYARRMLQYLIDEIRGTGYNGEIFICAEPEENSISVANLIRFYENMGLTVNA